MCQYSVLDHSGIPQQWHLVHLGSFAVGGSGLVFTEATAVSPEARISPRDTGIWTDEQRDAWKPIVEFVASQGAVPGIQLGHAGRKASTWPAWGFEDRTGTVPAAEGGWPSAGPRVPGARATVAHTGPGRRPVHPHARDRPYARSLGQ